MAFCSSAEVRQLLLVVAIATIFVRAASVPTEPDRQAPVPQEHRLDELQRSIAANLPNAARLSDVFMFANGGRPNEAHFHNTNEEEATATEAKHNMFRSFQGAAKSAQHSARNQDDYLRDVVLTVMRKGPKPVSTLTRVVVIGAGASGLESARILKKAGVQVFILEASNRLGGRMKTFHGETFPGHLHAEAGGMRFPPAHYATHAAIKNFDLKLRPFGTSSPEGLFYFQDVGYPIPRKYFNASHPDYDPSVVKMVLEKFGVEGTQWLDAKFEKTLEPLRSILDDTTRSSEENWNIIVNELDRYSTRTFLQSHGWKEQEIELWAVSDNQEVYLESGFLEFFRDYMGQWWSQNSYYQYPNNTGIYANLPEHGLWELVDGTESLARAYYNDLQDCLTFNAEVTAISYGKSHVTVTYKRGDGQFIDETYDYALITVPFLSLRHIRITPPLSHAKRKAIRQVYYTQSTKVLLSYKTRWWNQTNPLVPTRFNHSGLVDGKGGSTITDLPLRTTYYPTFSEDDSRGVLLASYTWGTEAGGWGARSLQDTTMDAATQLAEISGPAALDELETSVSQVWQHNPWLGGGAFCHFLPGQMNELYPAMAAPDGIPGSEVLFFAGEHISYTHTWIQGALVSGVRATLQLLETIESRPQMPSAPTQLFPSGSGTTHRHVKDRANVTVFCSAEMQSVQIDFAPGAVGLPWVSHRHVQAQIGYVVKGSMNISVSGYAQVLTAGQLYHVPPNVWHIVTPLTPDAAVMETFSPPKPEDCAPPPAIPVGLATVGDKALKVKAGKGRFAATKVLMAVGTGRGVEPSAQAAVNHDTTKTAVAAIWVANGFALSDSGEQVAPLSNSSSSSPVSIGDRFELDEGTVVPRAAEVAFRLNVTAEAGLAVVDNNPKKSGVQGEESQILYPRSFADVVSVVQTKAGGAACFFGLVDFHLFASLSEAGLSATINGSNVAAAVLGCAGTKDDAADGLDEPKQLLVAAILDRSKAQPPKLDRFEDVMPDMVLRVVLVDPASVPKSAFLTAVKVVTDGSAQPGKTYTSGKWPAGAVVGAAVGGVVLLVLIIVAVVVRAKKLQRTGQHQPLLGGGGTTTTSSSSTSASTTF